ncbi:MAG TPA: hypothetical protein PLV45_17405, partial [bacterium]|nr:hypothetical protein [bacterium]
KTVQPEKAGQLQKADHLQKADRRVKVPPGENGDRPHPGGLRLRKPLLGSDSSGGVMRSSGGS